MTLTELAGRLDLRLPTTLTLAQKAGLMNELLQREREQLWQPSQLTLTVTPGVSLYSLNHAAFSDLLSAALSPEGGAPVPLPLWDGRGQAPSAYIRDGGGESGGDALLVVHPVPDRAGVLELTVRWVPVLDPESPEEPLPLSETAAQAAVFYAASQAAAMGYSPDVQLAGHFAAFSGRAVLAAAADRARTDARSPIRPRENRWWRHGRG